MIYSMRDTMNRIGESTEFVESTEFEERQQNSQQNNKECCQGNFEKITTEIDIVIYIYNLLGFVDQMRLARVNVLLQDVFKTYIWRENYRAMKIMENSNGQILVLNGKGSNWLYLQPKDFEEFLEIYAKDVQELYTSNDTLRPIRMPTIPITLQDNTDYYTDEEEIADPVDYLELGKIQRQSSFGIWRIMRNLTHLSLGRRYIEHKHLEFVAKLLPHLESLEVKLDAQQSVGYQNVSSYCKSMLEMKNLKRLVLSACSPVMVTFEYRLYRDLVTTLQLKYLKLEIPLQHQEVFDNCGEMLKKPLNLEQLDIVIVSDGHNSPTKTVSSFFLNYGNLLQLTLQLPDITLNEEVLQIIRIKCKNLEILELQRTNIKCYEFELPAKITEISITDCKGLTCDNLKQILGAPNIAKFSLLKSSFSGQLVDLQISNCIQYLNCDSVDTRRLISDTTAMGNLKELTWYDPYNVITDLEDLMACHHLEKLHIKCDPIPLKALLQLKHLHTLSFHHVFALNWSYVEGLLKHLSLHELKIAEFCGAEVLDTPVLGFPTSVKIVRLNMNMIVQADFWLDLFCQNVELKLVFFGSIGPFHLKRIFNKPHFPKDLRTIEFSGVSINCDDLRRNFNETIGRTPFLKNFKTENYIVLCRQNRHSK